MAADRRDWGCVTATWDPISYCERNSHDEPLGCAQGPFLCVERRLANALKEGADLFERQQRQGW